MRNSSLVGRLVSVACMNTKVLFNTKTWILALSIAVLSGCVTTTDSAFTRKANTQEAVQKYVELGLEYIKRDDFVRAQKHLSRALEIDEKNAPALAALGLIYHRQGENDLAEKHFVSALDSDPNYTRGLTYYGAFLFSEQRYAEAKQQFEKASLDVRYNARGQIFTNIALCSLKLGQTDSAIEAYQKALRLDRMNGRALAGITELYIGQGEYEKANRYYNRLVRIIAQQGLRHTPQSLWQGIRIARYFGSDEQVESFAALLKELYPDSLELELYYQL